MSEIQLNYGPEHWAIGEPKEARDFRADFALCCHAVTRKVFEIIGTAPLSMTYDERGFSAQFAFSEWTTAVHMTMRRSMSDALMQLRDMGLSAEHDSERITLRCDVPADLLAKPWVAEFMSRQRTHRELIDAAIRLFGDE